MDEIIVDIELSDEIVVEALQDDDITVTIEDADEIDVKAFDYPPEIDILNQRVTNCEQNTLDAVATANSASELATQSTQIALESTHVAQSAEQSALAAAASAGEALQAASEATEAASSAQQTANQAAQAINEHAQGNTNPHPINTTQEFTDAQITHLSAEATYTPTLWSYLVGLFTSVPKSVKEHIVKIWAVLQDFSTKLEALKGVEPVSETGTFTLALSHLYKGIRCNSATNIDCNIPLNDTVAFPIKSVITIQQIGNGVVTAKAVSGVTLNGDAKTAGQYKFIQLWKSDTNVWNVIGGVS